MPSDHGQGLAHQEASSTISEPFFRTNCLQKAANGEKSSRPEAAVRWIGCSFQPRTQDFGQGIFKVANASCMSFPGKRMVAPSVWMRSWFPSACSPKVPTTEWIALVGPAGAGVLADRHGSVDPRAPSIDGATPRARNRWRVLCQEVGNRPPQGCISLISIQHQGPVSALGATVFEKKSMLTNHAIPVAMHHGGPTRGGKIDGAVG